MNGKHQVLIISSENKADVKKKLEEQIVVVKDANSTTAIIPKPGDKNPIYGIICDYISIHSKGGESGKRDNITNALLAREKRIKRQLDALGIQDNVDKTKDFIKVMLEQSQNNFIVLSDKGFNEVANEDAEFSALLEKLLNKQ